MSPGQVPRPRDMTDTAAKPKGPASYGRLVTMLKEEHGLGRGHANALVADTLREHAA